MTHFRTHKDRTFLSIKQGPVHRNEYYARHVIERGFNFLEFHAHHHTGSFMNAKYLSVTFLDFEQNNKRNSYHRDSSMEDTTVTTPMASASFDPYITRLQAAALGATRKSAGLPADIVFHRSMDPEFAQSLDAFSDRVLAITNRFLNLVSTVDQTQIGRGKGKAKLESRDDVVDNFHSLVVDSMDQLLERTVR